MCLFMFVALLPFVWYVLLPQHSSVHCWFTYRNMAVSVFAVLSYLYQMGTGGDMERRKIQRGYEHENISSYPRKGGLQRDSQ